MINTDKQFNEWVRRANLFLTHPIVWNNSRIKGAYSVTHEDKNWDPLYMGELPQLAQDLGIFDKMYPSEVPKPDKPFPQMEYWEADNTWRLIVLGNPVVVDAAKAGKLLNAGIPFKP
jgi:hypothetical protein